MLADFIDNQPIDSAFKILILTPSSLTDASLYDEQAVSLDSCKSVGELFDAHPDMNSSGSLGTSHGRLQLALEAIRTADLKDTEEPLSIKKATTTKTTAVATWAERWHQVPRSPLAYQITLTKPPDRRLHPTFLVRQDAAKFSCLNLYTMYLIITGHAFLGSYTQQFFPQHTQEQITCPCAHRRTGPNHKPRAALLPYTRRRSLRASHRMRPPPKPLATICLMPWMTLRHSLPSLLCC